MKINIISGNNLNVNKFKKSIDNISSIMEEEEDLDKNKTYHIITDIFYICDYILFFTIMVVVVISCVIVLIMFNRSSLYMFAVLMSKRVKNKLNLGESHHSVVPRFYVSLIWWIMLWVLFICIMATISKITHNKSWVLFGF